MGPILQASAIKQPSEVLLKPQMVENNIENMMEIQHLCSFHVLVSSLLHTDLTFLSAAIFCLLIDV